MLNLSGILVPSLRNLSLPCTFHRWSLHQRPKATMEIRTMEKLAIFCRRRIRVARPHRAIVPAHLYLVVSYDKTMADGITNSTRTYQGHHTDKVSPMLISFFSTFSPLEPGLIFCRTLYSMVSLYRSFPLFPWIGSIGG